jgi:membrane-bound lytic murein transglycosylase D
VIPETQFGATVPVRPWRFLLRADLMLLAASLFLLGGCGSTATVVKETLDFKPMVANAFSRAISIGSTSKSPSTTKTVTYPALPCDTNDPRVQKFVREYAYNQRETMKAYMARAREYLPIVKSIVNENGLPDDIGYLVLLESGANPEARSPANALGMWQFMPSTARSYGLRVDSWVDERLDPWKSTKAAMLYLKDLYSTFGCWRLALSAYNSGENKLNKVLCQEDASEYDEICSSRKLRRETREFFPRFLAMAVIAKNPGKYGFASLDHKIPDQKHELMTVEGAYALETLAASCGLPCEQLMELNPALVRNTTPPEGPSYSLRVPLGKKGILLAKLKDIPTESGQQNVVHVVTRGDNLGKILNRYKISKSKLAELNPDVNFRRKLRFGSRIVLPGKRVQTRKLQKPDRLSWLQ